MGLFGKSSAAKGPEPSKPADAATPKAADSGAGVVPKDAPQESKKKKAPKKPKIEVGDYTVHVNVYEARDLKGREGGGTSDPVVVLDCMGHKEKTTVKKKVLSCIWDENYYFNFTIEEPAELEQAKLNVAVYDNNTFTKNVLIGLYEFDLAYIYNEPDHELYKRWVPLTDTTDANEGIQGYLCLTIAVLGPKDEEKVDHTEEDKNQVDYRKSVTEVTKNMEGWLLRIQVLRAEDLPRMDVLGVGVNPYVVARFGGNPPIKTDVQDGFNPVWNQALQVPVMLPSMTDKVIVAIYDHDKALRDRVIATFDLSFKQIKESELPPTWVNLYGAPLLPENRHAQMMNAGRREGSYYRGKLLIGADAAQTFDPKSGTVKLDKDKAKKIPEPKTTFYILRFDCYMATDLPKGSSALVEVKIGKYVATSRCLPVKEGLCKWFEPFADLDCELPQSLDLVPDVFISVYKDTKTPDPAKRMSYLRFKVKDIRGLDDAHMRAKWHALVEDSVSGAILSDDFPGQLLCGIGFDDANARPSHRFPIERPMVHRYELRAHIYQGKNLPSSDLNGSADPFVILRCAGQSARTAVQEDTLFPNWFETLILHVALPDKEHLEQAPDLSLSVYDYDSEGSADFMGRFFFSVIKCTEHMEFVPTWHPIFVDDANTTDGAILASFQLIPLDQPYIPAPLPIRPEYKQCVIELRMIGLRELDSLIPLNMPYLEVTLEGALKETEPSNKPTKRNPNFLEIIEVYCDLPMNKAFCPTMNVKVRDSRFGGLIKPIIATASISLEPFVPWESPKNAGFQEDLPLVAQPGILFNVLDRIVKPDFVVESDSLFPFKLKSNGPQKTQPLQLLKKSANASGQLNGSSKPMVTSQAASLPPDTKDINLDMEEVESIGSAEMPPSAIVAAPSRRIRPKLPALSEPEMEINKVETKKLLAKIHVETSPKKLEQLYAALTLLETQYLDSLDEKIWFDDTPECFKGRWTIDDELEDFLKASGPMPFDDYKLFRGQKRGSAVLTTAKFTKFQEVGTLKTLVTIKDKDNEEQMSPNFKPTFNFEGIWERNVKKPQPVLIRVYVGEGRGIRPMDLFGGSDPYLIFELGKQKIDDRENFIKSTDNPKFFRCFEMTTYLPGISMLKISMYDMDELGGDDLIGETTIDLENRWFHKHWRLMKAGKYWPDYKAGKFPEAKKASSKLREPDQTLKADLIPLEWRTLRNLEAGQTGQGKLSLWIEMFEKIGDEIPPPMSIALPAPEPFEMRLIIHRCRKMVAMDSLGDMNDLYITVTLAGAGGFKEIKKETDTHWRAKKGKAQFFYRMKFDIILPMKDPRIKLQAWDRDIIGSNDAIGETDPEDFELNRVFKLAYTKKRRIDIPEDPNKPNDKKPAWSDPPFVGIRRRWVPVFNSNVALGPDGLPVSQGEIEIEMELLPKGVAEDRKNGEGQEAPNQFPKLPKPERMSFNPLRPDLFLKELIGPKACRAICIAICCCLCCAGAVFAGLMIGSQAIGSIVGNLAR